MLTDRYRLVDRVGSDTGAGAEFWCAEDTVLQREVAITVLRRLTSDSGAVDGDEDPSGATRADEMLVRARRAGSFEHPGCARLLDVLAPSSADLPEDVLGAAVTEWVPGRSIAETLADGLVRPITAARSLQLLAAAAESAHRHGLTLGCDHPQRIRITPDGSARLCFALPRPDLRPPDDVRGLGAVLYALLTSRWPLSGADAARAGLTAADRSSTGTVAAPSTLRPGVPVELDALATGTLGPESAPGRVHTAAAVHQLLTEVVDEADRVALFPPTHDGAPSAPDDVWQDGGQGKRPVDQRRRRKLLLGLGALGVGMAVLLGYAGLSLSSLLSDPAGPVIVVSDPVEPSDQAPGDAPTAGAAAAVANVEVYSPGGDRDNAGRVSRVIDGNTGSGWRTSVYKQQFPALKPGVGVMVSFASAVQLSGLAIDSPSGGTHIEIRSAPSADARFGDTVPIADTTLEGSTTAVSLSQSQPVQHVLLWITKLGGTGTEYSTEINEVEFRRAGL